jgi:hypothetical protein
MRVNTPEAPLAERCPIGITQHRHTSCFWGKVAASLMYCSNQPEAGFGALQGRHAPHRHTPASGVTRRDQHQV